MHKKNLLILEDRPETLGQLPSVMIGNNFSFTIFTTVRSFYTAICDAIDNNCPPSALIIDDYIVSENNLSGIDRENILTDDGDKTGTRLVETFHQDDEFTEIKKIPMILFSVHPMEVLKIRTGNLGETDNVFYIEKLTANYIKSFESTLQKI